MTSDEREDEGVLDTYRNALREAAQLVESQRVELELLRAATAELVRLRDATDQAAVDAAYRRAEHALTSVGSHGFAARVADRVNGAYTAGFAAGLQSTAAGSSEERAE